MKSKASLSLMEQLVMLLVFALAASLCMGVFAHADRISRQTARRDEAVLIAQNAAETLKSTADPERAKAFETGDFTLKILPEESGISGLCQAKIVVFYEEEEIFTLQTGWQEVAQ